MCAACQNPALCSDFKIRFRCPKSSCYRKLRHRLFCFFTLHFIDQKTETVSQINKGSSNCRSFFRREYKSCRIFPVAHAQWLFFDTDLAVCNGRAYLQHMCFQNSFFTWHQIVCVIFHKGSSFCVLHATGHNLHKSDHGCSLPVSLGSETVTLFHQSLHCQSRKLFKSAQVSEMCDDCLIVILFQESFQTDFNSCLNGYMTAKFLFISSF